MMPRSGPSVLAICRRDTMGCRRFEAPVRHRWVLYLTPAEGARVNLDEFAEAAENAVRNSTWRA